MLAWRLETALSLGVPFAEAAELAESSADLHELERLIGEGCLPRLAARILI